MKTISSSSYVFGMSLTICIVVALGCGGRTIGGGPSSDASVPADGVVPTDGNIPDTAVPPHDTYGHVWLSIWGEVEPPMAQMGLAFEAAFFGEDYDPIFTIPGHVTTETTPDGVVCDIYMVSGMVDPPEPDPPPQRDGGRITAWAGLEPDRLEAVFDGNEYDGDYRSFGTLDWPAWIDPGALSVQVEGEGSAYADAFRTEVILAMVPEILSPPVSDVPVPPDDEGNFLVSWFDLPALAEETLVTFTFNMDWDDSVFMCHPPLGYDHFLLPADWVAEWSWGGGYMSVTRLFSVELEMGDALVTIRTLRTRRQYVSFGIYEY